MKPSPSSINNFTSFHWSLQALFPILLPSHHFLRKYTLPPWALDLPLHWLVTSGKSLHHPSTPASPFPSGMKALGQLSAVFFQPSALGALALAPGDEWVTEPQCQMQRWNYVYPGRLQLAGRALMNEGMGFPGCQGELYKRHVQLCSLWLGRCRNWPAGPRRPSRLEARATTPASEVICGPHLCCL